LRRSGEAEKDRYLPWSKEEEGVYIFLMKQVPVFQMLFFIIKFDEITLICTDLYVRNSKADFVPILSWYMHKKNCENDWHVNIHVPLPIT
jgi:hypothetical protein